MQAVCSQCGETMMPGRVQPTRVEPSSGVNPQLSLVVGSPTSGNPIKAFVQGLHETGEEAFSIHGRFCPQCGRVEFFLNTSQLAEATRLARSAGEE